MIEIQLRDKNRLVVLNVVGKTPIRGRIAPNVYFHTPLELLLSSLGLCVGGKINDYCRMNDLNPAVFEKIIATFDSDKFLILIQRPSDFDPVHISRISDEISNCTIAKELKREVAIEWSLNSTPTPELLKVVEQPCCGAK